MQILGTGLSGLVGSKFVEMFSHKYEFYNLDLSKGVDITNEQQVMKAVEDSDSPVVIHMAAFTNPDAAQEQNGDKTGVCYKVNVEGTRNIAKAASAFGKHLIHISTAFVFDGEKETEYVESDPMNPIEWYGQTKAWAEEVVASESSRYTIFRIDQPFRSDPFAKPDTAHKLIAAIQNNTVRPLFFNHFFAPTIIEDFAKVLDWAIDKKPQGIFHSTCGKKISDYEYGTMIARALGFSVELQKGDVNEFLRTAKRPYQKNTALNSDTLFAQKPIEFSTLEEAILRLET